MFDKAGPTRHTNEVAVSMTLVEQEPFHATVFLKLGERLIDLLNDARAFIPVRGPDGATMIVAKTSIVSIIEKETEPKREKERPNKNNGPAQPFDPYKILRIKPSASNEEIRRAYKDRIKAVHPDSIAALDLDEDLARAALLATQKVNHAYKVIMKEREADPLKGATV